jgi:glycosyltransferase involved in cell wall biosynthesis
MAEEIKVSIITPCFNSEKTIGRTLDSVMAQTYSNLEYIIVDGGSRDATLDIIEQYRKKGNIILISERDNGVYDAMNKGIKAASGELIGIINSDDWYEADAVKDVLEVYEGTGFEVLYGFTKYWNGSSVDKIVRYSHENLERQMISHPSCFVAKKVYDKFGCFDTKYRSSADYEFMLRLRAAGEEVAFKPVNQLIANFRLGGISSSDRGVIETAGIRLNHGLISRKKYMMLVTMAKMHRLKEKRWKSGR